MIRPEDGKYCPDCHTYVNPWVVHKTIGKRESAIYCPGCDKWHDIDDLIDADGVSE